MYRDERQQRKRKEQALEIAKLLLMVVIIVCLVYIAVYYIRTAIGQRQYEQLEQESVVISAEITEQAEQYDVVPEVDFQELWQTSTDICAWIYIPDGEEALLSYPVLQRQDADDPYDDYYLNHTAEGQRGLPASIYIEPCNAADFSDYNTVVYGHHMKNGTMFGSLHAYLQEDYMTEHPYVYLVTPDKKLVYEVFAAVQFDDRHIMKSFSFGDAAGRQEYLDALRQNGGEEDLFREDVDVTAEDRLLTLSTCVKDAGEKRLLVEAVLVDESAG